MRRFLYSSYHISPKSLAQTKLKDYEIMDLYIVQPTSLLMSQVGRAMHASSTDGTKRRRADADREAP
jgi:hypothetical protein